MRDPICELRKVLLNAPSACLERLSGCLLGRLLSVPARISRSGEQHGGDGGVSGAGGRHLVFEARRYGDTSKLDKRSIVGEIQLAVHQKPSLEAWILVTTLEVPEQVQQAMLQSAEVNGIGTVIIDWSPQPLPQLAVLSARYPECIEAEIGKGHESLLATIAAMPGFDTTLMAIQSELTTWAIGYEAVRNASRTRVREIWESRRNSKALFGQDVAGGGEDAHHVRRPNLIEGLDAWWNGTETTGVGALVGRDGVGKTWAAIDWIQMRLDHLPILVLAPLSSIGDGIRDRTDLVRFLARYLHDLTAVRTQEFWEIRVHRLLKRPPEEGGVFVLFLDGLNQLSSCDWSKVFQQLQGDPFHQRVRTLMSARTNFFDERLNCLGTLATAPHRIDMGGYDLSPGGAFDQKLALSGLKRQDLPDHLITHAAVPRLFDLVVRLKDAFGNAKEVTIHRLLWAYGASTIVTSTDGAFSENDWRRFIRKLAEDYRSGNRRSTVERVTHLSADASLSPNRIYQRVSGVIDGIFTELSGEGEIAFQADFVHHALGLILVKQLGETGAEQDAANLLGKFLDPIDGYDNQAEILRAAVTIALQQRHSPTPRWLSTLCTYWLHTQNLPDSHLKDLDILAPELVTCLLDVIEASDSHSHSTARHIAVETLAKVDKSDPGAASQIAERGTRWLRFISLEKRGLNGDLSENSEHTHQCRRLRERIGTVEIGPVTVAGREFEIVDHGEDNLNVVAAQLLQGRPLSGAIDYFETGAIHSAITGNESVHESQAWLNILNTVDPEQTAAGLRRASQVIRERIPEHGVHRDLNHRIASLLLWRTGYADDAAEAWATDPKIDHWLQYDKDYLTNPSRSLFRLERRHAPQVLCDTDVPIFHRIERARDALLDPRFTVPSDFIDELISVAGEFEFSQTNTVRGLTREDILWERLTLALARCAPDKLADGERARLLQYAERPSDQRYGSALAAPQSMLLVGKDEGAALRSLREKGNDGSDDHENTIGTNILISEIQCEPPLVQVQKIMTSELEVINPYLIRACRPVSEEEIDKLLDIYDDDEQRNRLASILGGHLSSLSDRAFAAFSRMLDNQATGLDSRAVWILLGVNSPARLGAMLDELNWTWSPDRPHFENTMGSNAIAASNKGTAFTELARRLAPANLLEALSEEGRSEEDVKLVVDILSAVLLGQLGDPPESGLDISHDQSAARSGRYDFTAGDILRHNDDEDVPRVVEGMENPERYAERQQDILQTYVAAIDEARRAGAQLLFAHFEAKDFDPVLKHCPEAVDSWIEGLDSMSPDFRRRVRLAEGFFVALCEALLKEDASRGVPLWRALRECLASRFISHIGIDRLLHAVFLAPSCPEAHDALEEIYGMNEARSDADLIDFVIAARCSNRIDWLRRIAFRDATSSCPADRRRSVFLGPLLALPEIAEDADWPKGESESEVDSIRQYAWILGQREAFAYHWLREFAAAETPGIAHACWRLFKACADSRARLWMQDLYQSYATKNQVMEAAKQRFVEREAHDLKRAMADNEKAWAGNFAGMKYPKSLWPWNS